MDEYKYTLVIKKSRASHGLPMCRYRSTTKYSGARLCCTMRMETMKKFKDREDALFYLANCEPKYGDQIKHWKVEKIETTIKRFTKKPILQLHTGKMVSDFHKATS